MKNHYPFISMFKAEHYKTKRNIAVLSFLLFPFIVTCGIFVYYAIKSGALTEAIEVNPWGYLLGRNLYILYLVYPLLVSILVYSLCDMEYRNGNLQRLLTLPFSGNTIFASKILFLTEIVFVSTLIAYLSFLSSGFLLSYLSPLFSFQDYDIRLVCFYFHLRLFISLLAVSSVQLWISLIFRNFVIPMGFSCFMMMFSLLTYNKEYSYLNPFAAVYKSMNEFIGYLNTSFNRYDYVCLFFIIVFLLINLFTFKWKVINNKQLSS